MTPTTLRIVVFLLAPTLFFASSTVSASNNLSPGERDRQVVASLRAGGSCTEAKHVSVCAERGVLSDSQLSVFAGLAEDGAISVRSYLGEMLDLPGGNERKVEFYIGANVGIPHVTIEHEPWVFMHPDTIRSNMAPYVHEMVHAMAQWSWRKSEWMAEGFANHAAAEIVSRFGGYHRSFVLPNGLAELAHYFHSTEGQEVLPLVGAAGRRNTYSPENAEIFQRLMANRRKYAPPFYAMSWSFTDYVVDRCGVKGLRKMAEADRPDVVAKTICGSTLQELRVSWQKATFTSIRG